VMLSVKEGESLAEPLKRSGRFPSMFLHMITVGEKTGQLEDMLERVADNYDKEVDTYVKGMTSLMTPIMLLFMGGARRTMEAEGALARADLEAAYALEPGELQARLRPMLGDITDKVLSLYRKTRPTASASDLFFTITTAQMYWYTTTRVADRKAQQKGAPVYMYQFAYEGSQTAGNPPVALKAAHSLEIPFAFAHPRPNKANEVLATERALAKQMSQTWIAFARTGNPNNAHLPKWPTYSTKKRETMVFDATSKVVNDPHPAERQLWEELLRRAEIQNSRVR